MAVTRLPPEESDHHGAIVLHRGDIEHLIDLLCDAHDQAVFTVGSIQCSTLEECLIECGPMVRSLKIHHQPPANAGASSGTVDIGAFTVEIRTGSGKDKAIRQRLRSHARRRALPEIGHAGVHVSIRADAPRRGGVSDHAESRP
jgi:hypothetical protein